MVKPPSVFHPVAMTLMIPAIVVFAGLPYACYAQNRPAPQVENFQLSFQQGDPSFAGFDVPLDSPNLFEVIRQSGVDVDQMLATAGYSVDWLLSRTGKTTDLILDRSQVSAQFLLNASGNTADWLITRTNKDADWILSRSGHEILWLLNRTGGTADQLLEWADKDADWLLDQLDKDADWILDRSGYSISTMLGWANTGSTWVANKVKNILCGNLGGAAKSVCNASVNAVEDSISKLVGLIDRSADWWLDEADKDIDWLLGRAGKNADWMLSEASKSRPWLWDELGRDADWLLTKAGKSKSWLLTLTGNNVDWLLAGAGYSTSWLFQQIGGTADWLLDRTNHDADWLLDQIGWRLDEAELTFTVHLQLQVVTSSGIDLSYDGASQLQYVPGTPNTPKYDRRVVILGGNFKVAEGLGATNTSVSVTYRDPTGITATASGDVGVLNQDLAITIDSGRRLNRTNRHSDDWLMTFCIPLKLIISALLVEVPPASAAALELVPDVMMQAIGDVGFRFGNERVNPAMGNIEIITLPQPQSFYEFVMGYQGQIAIDAKLNSGSWGFAWGLPCTLGVGISMGFDIPGGQTLVEAGPVAVSAQTPVRFQLRRPSDWQVAPPRPPTRRPGTLRPVTPVQPPPQIQPQPVPQPAEPTSPPPTSTQPIEQQEQPRQLQQFEPEKTDKK